jgi:predicted O-methyltransferase YrrM
MLIKPKRIFWFARNPRFWRHGAALVARRLANADRHELARPEATAWAAERTVTAEEALTRLGVFRPGDGPFPAVPADLLLEAEKRARSVTVRMGGAADLELLYASVLLTRPGSLVETGVAYGWSSLAILAAMEANDAGRLISVDMPYPRRNNEEWVGVVVPQSLRPRWTLIREPDRNGIDKAIAAFDGEIDLCHYDSDKSYAGRNYAYPRLWNALRPGGIFISDDIQDNFGFRDFVTGLGVEFQVTERGGKYIGIARK